MSQTAGSEIFEFKPFGMGRTVQITPHAVIYEIKHANWLTWLLVIFTGGLAAFAWPWIRFGRRRIVLPKRAITAIALNTGARAGVTMTTTTGVVKFHTDRATAEAAINALAL